MATYRLTGPDGSTYEVTPPEGTSEADIIPTFLAHLGSQQALEGAPDVEVTVPASGSRPARTMKVPAWAQTWGGQWSGETAAPQAQAAPSPAQPRRMGLVEAAGKSAAAGEQRVEDILSELTRPAATPEESTVTGGLKRTGRALAGLAGNLIPTGNIGQMVGGTYARMQGQSPEDVAAAEQRGGDIGALAPLGLSLGARAATKLIPGARAAARGAAAVTGAGLENLGAGVAQAGQVGERAATGEALPEVAKSIRSRLSGKVFSAVRDEAGEEAQQTLQAYDTAVTTKLANMGTGATTPVRLAKDPQVLQGLLTHATPDEADVIQRAVDAGKPLSALPWTPDQLARIGEQAAQRKGLFSVLKNHPVGAILAGVLGEHAGLQAVSSHPAAATAIAVGAATLKTFDALAGSRKGYALLKWLSDAPAGSLAAQAGLRKLGDIAGGPQELTPPEPVVARALGGGVLPDQTALVGERGPELVTSPAGMQVTPLQLAQARDPSAPSMPAPEGMVTAPGGGYAAPVVKTLKGGLGKGGSGLSDEDVQKVRKGGPVQIIMGPDGPVVVRP